MGSFLSCCRCCCCCRVLPHGWYSVAIATLATAAWLASLFQGSCNYALVKGPIVQQLDPTFSAVQLPFLQFGLTEFQEPKLETIDDAAATATAATGNYTIAWWTGECQEYPEEQLVDTAWTAARTFSFLALVLGGGSTFFLWCSTCFVFSKVTWRWTGYGLLLATICNSLTFVWFATQLCDWNTCTLSYGAKSDIVAVVLWGISGWMIISKYPSPHKPELVAQSEQEVDEQEDERDKQQTDFASSDLELVEPDVVIEQGTGETTMEELQYNPNAESA